MTPSFIFKLGTLDLSTYVRVNPDDKMDPYGQPWLTPAFTETPFADGQPLISTTVGNREQMWPLFLKDESKLKDQLHALIESINIAAGQKPLQVEWRDDGASRSTFFDVAFLRFEPDFNFRRSQHGYGAGILHIWVSGYGHTGTVRIAGTAAGTGIFLSVPMPSVAGDAPALMDTTITAGAVLPTLGRIVAVAPISHPSYSPLIPAASLLEAQPGATLIGASGAQGSQYLALPVSPTGGASGVACRVPLQNPTIMGGDNRILAVVKSGIESGVAVNAYDPYGNALGGTAIASMSGGWGIIDLGVCRLPTVGFPTQPQISIQAGGVWASGAAGPGVVSSPGLQLNEVIVLPDKNLALVLESTAGRTMLSRDSLTAIEPLILTTTDSLGNPWRAAQNHAHEQEGGKGPGRNLREVGGEGLRVAGDFFDAGFAGASALDAAAVAGIHTDMMKITAQARFQAAPTAGYEEVRLFKDIQASQFVQARLAASGFMALEVATGGASGIRLASVAIATFVNRMFYTLSLQVRGPEAFVTLSQPAGFPVFAPGSMAQASIGVASNAAIAGAGAPALAMGVPSRAASQNQVGPALSAWEVSGIASTNLAAYDSYRIDGPDADAYRTASSGVFAGQKLVSAQRGAFPKAAPSTSSVAVVCAPFDQGAANDKISAVVSLRERFFYAR